MPSVAFFSINLVFSLGQGVSESNEQRPLLLVPEAGNFSGLEVAAHQGCFPTSARARYPGQRLSAHAVQHGEEALAGIDIGQDGAGEFAHKKP